MSDPVGSQHHLIHGSLGQQESAPPPNGISVASAWDKSDQCRGNPRHPRALPTGQTDRQTDGRTDARLFSARVDQHCKAQTQNNVKSVVKSEQFSNILIRCKSTVLQSATTLTIYRILCTECMRCGLIIWNWNKTCVPQQGYYQLAINKHK